jgi:ATP-dependent RNA helicase DeaD
VFVRTKIRCDQLFRTLRDRGMNVRALHGDMSQGSRDGVMLAFKGGRVPILVATDVAARGLDISTVTHVINYDVPDQPRHLRASHRAHRARRALGPGDHVRRGPPEARARGDRTPHRHVHRPVGGGRGGRRRPSRRAPAQALQAPHLRRGRGGALRQAGARGGRAAGLRVADIVGAVTSSAGLDGEAVRDVMVLDRFSFLSVPAGRPTRGDRRALDGHDVRGQRSACSG